MTSLPIIIAPDDRLLVHATTIYKINDEIKSLAHDMFHIVKTFNAFGLAATQVGISKRIFVIRIPLEYEEQKISQYHSTGSFCMINPEIIEYSTEKVYLTEGCLSIPEQYFEIQRSKNIFIKYWDLTEQEHLLETSGWLARCIQHELDHLNGILCIKYISKLKHEIAIKKAKKIQAILKNSQL